MKLLILGDQHNNVAASLQRQLSLRPEQFHLITADAADLSAPELTALLQKTQADVLIYAAFPVAGDDGGLQRQAQLLSVLINEAQQRQCPLVFLSSAAVFDGARIAYQEADAVCPASDYGKWYAEREQAVSACAKHMIIRTGWLYSSHGANFLTATIDYAAQDALISVNSAGKACPTSVDDLARVLLAILLQLDLQAENWGIFHYVASDTALGFQFIEAILAQASQYESAINPKQLRFEHSEQPDAAFYFTPVVLKCHRLLEDFGIHQRPWRSLLSAVVKAHYQQKNNHKKGA